MSSERMPRREFLTKVAAAGAVSMIPKSVEAGQPNNTEGKTGQPRTLSYLDQLMESLAGRFKLNETELRELVDLKQKHKDWSDRGFPEDNSYTEEDNNRAVDLHDKLQNYVKVLKSLAELYPKASDYKGKNVAQEDLDRLNIKLKALKYEP
jgi:hypothetical protein